jgi:hypothetical protein
MAGTIHDPFSAMPSIHPFIHPPFQLDDPTWITPVGLNALAVAMAKAVPSDKCQVPSDK